MKTKLITLFLLLTLLLVPMSNAYAQSPGGDVVLVGENYTLKSDEVLNGSLVVIGGNVTIEKGAKVSADIVVIGGNLALDGNAGGDIVIIGGNATISSKASGDVVTIGGQTSLTKTAVVKGDTITVGGQLKQEEGAKIEGKIVNNTSPSVPYAYEKSNPFWDVAGVLRNALIIAAVSMLLTLFLQPQIERVSDTIAKQPFLAGSFGLMSIVIVLFTFITLILIPVSLFVAFIAWIFGVIAIGQVVGERFTKAINQVWAPVLSTGFGTFLLALGVGLFALIPCVGWLAPFLTMLVALGGVVVTWFGTRNAPGKPAAPVVAEVPPAS